MSSATASEAATAIMRKIVTTVFCVDDAHIDYMAPAAVRTPVEGETGWPICIAGQHFWAFPARIAPGGSRQPELVYAIEQGTSTRIRSVRTAEDLAVYMLNAS